MITLISILLSFFLSISTYATPNYLHGFDKFEKIVPSKLIMAECDVQKGDERGPFGITYKEGNITHDFLVLTGVYNDTCKDLENRIRNLKKKYSRLILFGTEKTIFKDPNNFIWRWRSVRAPSGKECVSYFGNDCE